MLKRRKINGVSYTEYGLGKVYSSTEVTKRLKELRKDGRSYRKTKVKDGYRIYFIP